jgi:hypothetical protein
MTEYVMETYRKHGGDRLTAGSSGLVFKKIALLPSRNPDKPQSSFRFSSAKNYE